MSFINFKKMRLCSIEKKKTFTLILAADDEGILLVIHIALEFIIVPSGNYTFFFINSNDFKIQNRRFYSNLVSIKKLFLL